MQHFLAVTGNKSLWYQTCRNHAISVEPRNLSDPREIVIHTACQVLRSTNMDDLCENGQCFYLRAWYDATIPEK